MNIVIGLTFLVIFGFILWLSYIKDQEEQRKAELKLREKEAKKKKLKRRKQLEDGFKEKYGDCTNRIDNGTELFCPMYIFNDNQVVIINDKPYKYGDVLSFNIEDTPITKKGESVATTKSNTGSMVGRAIVGDLVAGPAGMVLGGATGKKTTIIKQGDDIIQHDYTVYITTRDLSSPLEKIHTGNNSLMTNKIISALNIITEINNKQ